MQNGFMRISKTQQVKFRSIFCIPALGALMLVAAGCGGAAEGPPIGGAGGKVTFEGEAVSEGLVLFGNDDGFAASTELSADGSYRFSSQYGDGIPVGTYKVSITPPAYDPGPAGAEAPPEPPNPDNIPAKYRVFTTSGFTAEVKEGDNTFDFDMKP